MPAPQSENVENTPPDGSKSGGGNSGRHRNPLTEIVGPFAGSFVKAGGYYVRSWGSYLGRARSDLPPARPTLSLASHALRDELVLVGLLWRRPLSDRATYDRINAEVNAAISFYGKRGWLDTPAGFFPAPPAPTDVVIRSHTRSNRTHERLTFDSDYEPHPGEPGAERWSSYTGNRRMYATMLRHKEPRPWLVCIHGTEMGRPNLDQTIFRAWHLHKDLGLNVVLPVLPLHGPRAKNVPNGAVFPSEDMLDDVHGTAQAVWDVRRVLAWIRAQQPGARIGLNSISMGGYIAALVASLDDDLTCAILGVPPANLIDLLSSHSGLSEKDPRQRTIELAQPLGRMLSPLHLTPKVAPKGRFIYAGVADRIVHPRKQVLQLWEHWGRPEIGWYRGGHTGFFESRPVARYVDAAVVQSGLVDGEYAPKK